MSDANTLEYQVELLQEVEKYLSGEFSDELVQLRRDNSHHADDARSQLKRERYNLLQRTVFDRMDTLLKTLCAQIHERERKIITQAITRLEDDIQKLKSGNLSS